MSALPMIGPHCGSAGLSRLGLLVLILSIATILHAQMPSQGGNSGGAQSPGTWACSDPLLAGTPECAGQTQQGSSLLLNPQTPSHLPGESGAQSGSPYSDYSDIEQLSRQVVARNQAPLAPEPLTEFQQFVASTTGQILPIFGADLFRSVPSTFAPLEMTPVPLRFRSRAGRRTAHPRLGTGELPGQSARGPLGRDISSPDWPGARGGHAFSALDAHLRGAVGRVYHNFDLTADVGQIRAIQVYVAGQARRPGVYTVSSLSTLVDALFASGGPSVQGSMRHIQLRRGERGGDGIRSL